MSFNYNLEKAKFDKRWEKLREEYIAAGMTEEQIKAIYEYDWNEFNRNRAYYRHSLPLSEAMSLSVTDTYSSEDLLDWIEEINDIVIYTKLRAAPKEKLIAYTLHNFYGYTALQISSKLMKNRRSVCRWIGEIAELLK